MLSFLIYTFILLFTDQKKNICGTLLEARSFGKLIILKLFGLYGGKEKFGILRIKWRTSRTQ